jgi:Spy/CpxP family protein refolding chaperone
MKKLYLAIGFLALVALATSTFAFGPGGRGDAGCAGCPGLEAGNGPSAGKGAGRWAAELNLTKEQQDKLSELRKRQWEDTKPLRDEMYPATDDATIIAGQKDVNALQQKMQEKMVQFKLEQRRVFTPEQLNKMKDLPQGFGKDACGGFGRGRGHGKG